MTKEEAIKILKEIIDEGWLISDFDKCIAIDACEMAIKALEQEHCEDAISRQATEEIIKELARHLPEAVKKVGEQIEADGCGDCAYWSREEWEEPCKRCKRNCKDYWRKKRW